MFLFILPELMSVVLMAGALVTFDPDDPVPSVAAISDALQRGSVVGLPTEAGYLPVVLPSRTEHLGPFLSVSQRCRQIVLLERVYPFLDAFPAVNGPLKRLLKRCWPGPIVVEMDLEDQSRRILDTLGLTPLAQQQRLCATMSASRAIDEVLLEVRQSLAGVLNYSEGMVQTAQELRTIWQDRLEVILDAGPSRFQVPPTCVRVSPSTVEVLEQGVIGEEMVHRMAAEVYLFVCTGNTCRSPMAEGLFRQMLATQLRCPPEELVSKGILVLSAGLAAAEGMPASEEAVALLRERGIDLHGHSSQPVTHELLQHSDHVFTMTRRHRDQILRTYPELRDQVDLLSPTGNDIHDPIGGGWDEYQECLEQIETALQSRLRERTSHSG